MMRVQATIELSEREERFLWALANGLRPTRAALVAGYSAASARNLLKKPHVREALKAVHRNTSALVARIEKAELKPQRPRG